MQDITLATLLTRIVALFVILAVYGLVLSWAAARMGDPGPAEDGRMTFNPFAHLDILGAIAFLIFGMGWMRPLSVDPGTLRWNAAGLLPVLLCGFLSLLLLASIAILLLPWAATTFSYSGAPVVGGFLVVLARLAVGFALFNLVPLPPTTAGQFLFSVYPRLCAALDSRRTIVGLVMLALLATSFPGRALAPVNQDLLRFLSRGAPMVSTLR